MGFSVCVNCQVYKLCYKDKIFCLDVYTFKAMVILIGVFCHWKRLKVYQLVFISWLSKLQASLLRFLSPVHAFP